jgi:hypothetical protein
VGDRKLLRMTGSSGLALVILALDQFPLYLQGDPTVSVYGGPARN